MRHALSGNDIASCSGLVGMSLCDMHCGYTTGLHEDHVVFYGPPSRGQTNKVWRDLRAAIDLPEHLTPHSLRHTFASTMPAEGVPLVRVAALCGHTVDVCARTYAHWIGGVDSEAAQVLERARRAR